MNDFKSKDIKSHDGRVLFAVSRLLKVLSFFRVGVLRSHKSSVLLVLSAVPYLKLLKAITIQLTAMSKTWALLSVISFSDRFEVEEDTVLFVGHHFFIRRYMGNILFSPGTTASHRSTTLFVMIPSY